MKLPLLLLCYELCSYALQLNEVPPLEEQEVQQLVDLVHQANREGTKRLLAQLVHEGEQQLEDVLSRFKAMGYDYTLLLQWLASDKAPPKLLMEQHLKAEVPVKLSAEAKSPAKQLVEHPSAHDSFQLLLKGLKSSNKTLVKDAFAQMLQEGGQTFLSSKLQELQHMGYDIEDIKKWYAASPPEASAKASQGKVPSTTSLLKGAAEDADDGPDLLTLMKTEDGDGMRAKIADIFKHGGEARIQSALKTLQALGYDPADVELMAAGKKMRHQGGKVEKHEHDETKHKEENTQLQEQKEKIQQQKEEILEQKEKILEQKEKILEQQEKAQKEEIQKEKMLQEEAQKKMEEKNKINMQKQKHETAFALETSEALSLVKSIAEGDRAGARKQLGDIWSKGGQAELQEVLQRAQFPGHDAGEIQAWVAEASAPVSQPIQPHPVGQAAQAVAPAQPVQHQAPQAMAPASAASAASLDTELLVLKLRDGNRKAAADAIIQMFQAGGQSRIQRALGGLKLWGYDPERFQQWVSAGVPGLVAPAPPQPAKEELTAMVDALKHWNRPKASELVKSVYQKGGQPKVQELFADLQAVGYDPKGVQIWLSEAAPTDVGQVPPLPTDDLTSLAAESKVKLLKVQDFQVAVSDLSTASLKSDPSK